MSAPGPAEGISLEVLLEHREWVRALARTLVADPHAADDVEQETWRMALERPPRHARSLRAWFGTVVRHAAAASWRRDARRARGEAGLPPPRFVPAPDDVVAEAELQTRLAGAVLDLDEPYRSTVLRRFVRGESPTEIAARTSVPVDTVKTRLRRALATLRERLSGARGDDRKAWVLLLAGGAGSLDGAAGRTGLTAPGGAVAAAGGGLVAMGLGAKWAKGIVVLVLAGTWFALREDAADGTRQEHPGAASGDESVAVGGAAEGRPRAGRAGPAADGTAPGSGPVAAKSFRGRVVDADGGAPIEGARVSSFAHPADTAPGTERVLDPGPALASTISAADGSFEFPAAGAERAVFAASARGRVVATAVAQSGSSPVVIVLRAGAAHGTQVVSAEDGKPVAGARILVFTPGNSPVPASVATADTAGRASVELVDGGSRVCLAAHGYATTDLWAALPAKVFLSRGLGVAGTVAGTDGRPLSGATLTAKHPVLGNVVRRTGADGRFAFDGFPAMGAVGLRVSADRHFPVGAVAALGDASVSILLVPRRRDRGRVLDPAGRPVADAVVRCSLTAGLPESSARTDEEGRFEIDAPSAGAFVLRAESGEIADERYGLGVPALSGEQEAGSSERGLPEEVVIRVAPPVLSYARIDAFDAEGTRLAIEGLAASGRVAERADDSGRLHLVFECPAGTRVAGRISTFGAEGVRQPEFPLEVTTGADGDVDVVSVRPPTSPLLRIRLLGADGTDLPAGTSGTAILWEVGGRGRRCLGSGPATEGPLWRVETSKRYAVEVWVAGRVAPPHEFTGADAAGGPVAVRLRPAPRVRGRLTGPDGLPPGCGMLRETGGRGTAHVQPNGEFEIALSREGDVGIEVLHGLDPWWTGTYRVASGQVLDAGEIRLPAMDVVEVRGRVLEPSGTPAGGAEVSWRRADGNAVGFFQTDASGAFTMQRPRGERGIVLAEKIGRGAAWRAVEVSSLGTDPVDVTLRPAGRVRVTFRGDLDALRSIDSVGVRSADGALVWYPRRDDVESRRIDESIFLLEDLPPGPLTVFGRSELRRFEGDVTVVAGATTAVTIDERE